MKLKPFPKKNNYFIKTINIFCVMMLKNWSKKVRHQYLKGIQSMFGLGLYFKKLYRCISGYLSLCWRSVVKIVVFIISRLTPALVVLTLKVDKIKI